LGPIVSSREIDGWVLIQAEGKTYLGKPPEGFLTLDSSASRAAAVYLEPVYEFAFIAIPTPQGIQQATTLKAPFGMASIRGLTVPTAIWVPLASLSREERAMFSSIVREHEEQVQLARAAQAGILTAGAIPAGLRPPTNAGRR
jgi:hypothetical protein